MRIFKAIGDFFKLYNMTRTTESDLYLTLNKFGIDWFGRPWRVFDIPNEFLENEETLNSFTTKKLSDINFIFEKLRIDGLVYPEITIDYKEYQLLVIFKTNTLPIKRLFKTIFIILIFVLIGFIARLFL